MEQRFLKIYYQIIDNALKQSRTKLPRTSPNYVYYERHHILPRCMGGSNESQNLVLLTGREHFICHLLLAKAHPSNIKLAFALHRMQKHRSTIGEKPCSARTYESARIMFSVAIKELHQARMRDPDIRVKAVKTLWENRIKNEDKRRANLAKSQKGRIVTQAMREKISKALTGRKLGKKGPLSDAHKSKLAKAKIGSFGNNSQMWEITFPNGTVEITGARKEFCALHNLNYDSVKTVSQTAKPYKGYLFRKLVR